MGFFEVRADQRLGGPVFSTDLYLATSKQYRVSLNRLIIFQGAIEGPQKNKKLYGRGGPKIQPWGDMGKILVFGLILQKNS